MTPKIHEKLTGLVLRHEEVAGLLGEAEIIQNQQRFRTLSQEYAQLEPVVTHYRDYQACQAQLQEAQELSDSGDPDLAELAAEELPELSERLKLLERTLQTFLIPRDPRDEANVFLEVRAGTGGDEAAIFAGDLLRMYSRYAENRGWRVEPISERPGEHGGYKEAIIRIIGQGAYSALKFESGAHRVQRVPETESQGRIHTSAATVAIMPEVEEVDSVDINPSDLRVDTFRASGAGGQHVNRTDSAIRITHLPSGIVVECQDERSQHKNRARAMSVLSAKLLDQERSRQNAEESELRRLQVGSGDRSERIRTYNFPQGRLTDHRVNLTLYKLEQIMGGDLTPVLTALASEHQADQLAELAQQ